MLMKNLCTTSAWVHVAHVPSARYVRFSVLRLHSLVRLFLFRDIRGTFHRMSHILSG
jgi:hypothetical protein